MVAALQTDAYKISHKGFMNPLTEVIYSNLTARSFKHFPVPEYLHNNKAVFVGLQYFIINYLYEEWDKTFFDAEKEDAIYWLKRRFDTFFGPGAVDVTHFEELHDLGFLPLEIKALPEGSRVDVRVPFLTVKNTLPQFAWLTNYIETVLSTDLWKPITVATIAYAYRQLCDKYALETTGSTAGVEFQCHDFSFRGMSGRHDAAACGFGHLLSFNGTDTLPAIDFAEQYYGADAEKEFIAASVPASEHSVTSLGIALEGELEFLRHSLKVAYPTGIVSLVSDTLDYWKVITEYAVALKDDILARQPNALGLAKTVFRPDSGDPVDIICGIDFIEVSGEEDLQYKFWDGCDCYDQFYTVAKVGDKYYSIEYFDEDKEYEDPKVAPGDYPKLREEISSSEVKGSIECLWDIFGGTITEQGYKLLNPKVGLIYGDSISIQRAEEIFKRLKAKGFASSNVVFGVGSYSYNYLTRDSLGMAVKATHAKVDGKDVELFKDPKTDSGMKKSARGLLRVEKEGNNYVLYDQQTEEQEQKGELKTVFVNGVLINPTTLEEIRQRLKNGGV